MTIRSYAHPARFERTATEPATVMKLALCEHFGGRRGAAA